MKNYGKFRHIFSSATKTEMCACFAIYADEVTDWLPNSKALLFDYVIWPSIIKSQRFKKHFSICSTLKEGQLEKLVELQFYFV